MSNNIYDILKTMRGLDNTKSALTEGKTAKPDFLDMDKDGDKKEPMKKAAKEKSKGAIAEAIARVEQQLAEKYMGFKKTAAAVAKGGSANDPEAVAAAIGRKKYGKEKFQKAAAAGKKLGEGDANEDVLTPKEKEFAKLAPPKDKITYADKITGAKKTDEAVYVKPEARARLEKEKQEKAQAAAMPRGPGVDLVKRPANEGFPTVADAEKRMREKEGKTAHGKKTTTATGTRHERDYDAVDKGADVDMTPKGRGRPKKDKFAK